MNPGILCIADIRGDIEQCVVSPAPQAAHRGLTRPPRPLTSLTAFPYRIALLRLNRLVRETGAIACIHTGDFGLYERQSIERISDK